MSNRLIYVIGPSGAGKDSVLLTLRQKWNIAIPSHWARRTITRPASPHGEQHEAVDDATFNDRLIQSAFALHWVANGLQYGIRHDELTSLSAGSWVFVNGSRAYLPELLQRWPQATVVHVDASASVLEARLVSRARESAQAIEQRLARNTELPAPPGCLSIENTGSLDDAADALMSGLALRIGA
jgi:ribose 1,5-bisphosphokinase